LTDDTLVDSAAVINQLTTKKYLDQAVIKDTVSEYYPAILRGAAMA